MDDIKIINNTSHDINDNSLNNVPEPKIKHQTSKPIDEISIDNPDISQNKSNKNLTEQSGSEIKDKNNSPPKKADKYETGKFGYYSGKKLNYKTLSYMILIISITTYYGFRFGMNVSYILFILSLFINKNVGYVCKSLKLNYIFYITLLAAIIIFSTKYGTEDAISTRIISGIVTIILCGTIGWYVHYISHTINYRRLYTVILKYLSKVTNGLSDKLINSYIKDTMYFISDNLDFHSIIHHNPELNRLWYNRLMETIQNLVSITVPVWYAAYKYKFNFSINNTQYFLNKTIPIFWGLLYTTNHNINYFKIQPKVHEEHHLYDTTKSKAYHTSKQQIPNLGWPDTLDFIFNTKYKTNIVENFNHASYNIIILVIIVVAIKTKFTWLNKFI